MSKSDILDNRSPWSSLPATALGCIEQLAQLAPPSPHGVDGHAYFQPAKAQRREHLVISFVVHGNEWGTLPAALRLFSDLQQGLVPCRGPVSLLLGNIEAVRQGVRYVEEDYNRVFVFDQPPNSLERRRAEAVRPILDEADFLFDLHQTQTPTESGFWTFPWTSELSDWASIIGAAPRALVRAPGGAFSPGKMCLDEYVRARGKVGITAEFGEKGADDAQAQSAYESCVRLISAYDRICLAETSRAELAECAEAPRWFQTVDVVAPPSPHTRLRPGLGCFTRVSKGELLSAEGSDQLRASEDGYVLFPKYPPPGTVMPPEIFRLAIEIEDPRALFGS